MFLPYVNVRLLLFISYYSWQVLVGTTRYAVNLVPCHCESPVHIVRTSMFSETTRKKCTVVLDPIHAQYRAMFNVIMKYDKVKAMILYPLIHLSHLLS